MSDTDLPAPTVGGAPEPAADPLHSRSPASPIEAYTPSPP
jgi:hypothetical protein